MGRYSNYAPSIHGYTQSWPIAIWSSYSMGPPCHQGCDIPGPPSVMDGRLRGWWVWGNWVLCWCSPNRNVGKTGWIQIMCLWQGLWKGIQNAGQKESDGSQLQCGFGVSGMDIITFRYPLQFNKHHLYVKYMHGSFLTNAMLWHTFMFSFNCNIDLYRPHPNLSIASSQVGDWLGVEIRVRCLSGSFCSLLQQLRAHQPWDRGPINPDTNWKWTDCISSEVKQTDE